MAMDKNELRSLLNKVPKIGKTQELQPDQRLVFLYLQLQERKKTLYRSSVEVLTATKLAAVDDQPANELASQQIKESTARMKALRWEIDALNEAVSAHITEFGDLNESTKAQMGIDFIPSDAPQRKPAK
jgi:hypothetical protein